jgi:hypothetical protein
MLLNEKIYVCAKCLNVNGLMCLELYISRIHQFTHSLEFFCLKFEFRAALITHLSIPLSLHPSIPPSLHPLFFLNKLLIQQVLKPEINR